MMLRTQGESACAVLPRLDTEPHSSYFSLIIQKCGLSDHDLAKSCYQQVSSRIFARIRAGCSTMPYWKDIDPLLERLNLDRHDIGQHYHPYDRSDRCFFKNLGNSQREEFLHGCEDPLSEVSRYMHVGDSVKVKTYHPLFGYQTWKGQISDFGVMDSADSTRNRQIGSCIRVAAESGLKLWVPLRTDAYETLACFHPRGHFSLDFREGVIAYSIGIDAKDQAGDTIRWLRIFGQTPDGNGADLTEESRLKSIAARFPWLSEETKA